MSEHNGSLRTRSWSSFLFDLGVLVGSVNNSSDTSEEYGSPRWCLSTLSLDTIAGVIWIINLRWRCHGWWCRRTWGRLGMIMFLPWRCHRCWRRQAWGRTRWWTRNHDWYEVFCITLYPNTFFLRDVVFDHWSIRKNFRFHRKAFRATILLACYRGPCAISSKYPFQRNSNPFCWSCASTLRSLQQIVFPQV